MKKCLQHFTAAASKRSVVSFFLPENNALLMFTIEGILFAIATNIINNNNNLFALRLGATDAQLSLVSSIPQFVGLLVLLPLGILTDRMHNKRLMVNLSLLAMAVFYLLIGFVPYLDSYRFTAFLLLLSISMGPMTGYNASWQAYFSDVVPFEKRNRVLTARTGSMFFVNVALPLATGALLAYSVDIDYKIRMHQIFSWFIFLVFLLQITAVMRIKGGYSESISSVKLPDFKIALKELVHHKPFMKFLGGALFFYLFWQADWTLYFLGQVNYLRMNEAWLSYASIGAALAQFLTIGFWSRINEKLGPRFGVIFGNLGLALCPICIIVSTSLPPDLGPVVFLILNTLANLAFATIPLNIPQYLLSVIPEENKTLSISIYTIFITLSNAIMPMAGVKAYQLLGNNLNAFRMVFAVLFLLRVLSSFQWYLSYRSHKKELYKAG